MEGPPALVGRKPETDAVLAAYDIARSEQPGTILIAGEAGIGKSRLVAAAVRMLPEDPLVLHGSCLGFGADGAPYVPFVAVLRDLVRRLGRDEVAALLPAEGTALGDWLPDLGPAPARYPRTRLLEEMLALVSRIARRQPVILVVEDLHWADASSRELFAYLARNLTDSAVLLIGTVRTGELAAGHPNRRLLAELGRRDGVTRIDLGPFESRDVAELLEIIDGRPAERSRTDRIHRRSGGNPLFVEALSNAGEAAADDLQSLLLDRITDLGGPAREVLSTMAVAGAGLTGEILHEVLVFPGDQLQLALNDLVGRDLVVAGEDGYAIRHDLIREAVYASLSPVQRRRMHAQYAEHATNIVAVAEHWAAAGEYERALPAAWRAAELAMRQNAYDEQLHLLELILTRWNQVKNPAEVIGTARTTVLESAAVAALAAGKSATGVAHCTVALDETAEPQRVARLLGLRGQLQNRLDGTGRRDLERAITLLPPGSSDPVRSRLLSALGFICVGADRLNEGRRYTAEALDIADRLDDDGLRAPALLVLAALDGANGDTQPARQMFAETRRLAEAAGDEHVFLTSFQWEAGLIEATGQFGQAADLAHAGQQAAERLGRIRWRGSMLAAARAIPLRLLGRWDDANEVVADALADGPPPLHGAFLRVVAADIARCRGETDRFETLLRQLTEFARHAAGAVEATAVIILQRIAWAIDQGELDLADRVLSDHLGLASLDWPAREVLRLAVLGARVQRAREAAAPRRSGREIAARFAELTRLADAVPATTPVLNAYRLTFQALASPETLPAWDLAAAAWRELGEPYETATVLTEAATTALASNNRPGARSRLREARTLAAGLGATPLLARIDELVADGGLGDVVAPPVHNDFGLTRRELEVLRVLARGRSNPQIATELFISTNTVATHVARILVKLEVATRTEAVGRALQSGLLDT
ncbi:MAG: AAA family ATPase [Kibdelosporangium sp.]